MGILDNLRFKIAKPRAVIIAGFGKAVLKDTLVSIFSKYQKTSGVFIYDADLSEPKKIKQIADASSLPVFLMAHGELKSGGGMQKIKDMLKDFPVKTRLVLNYDDENVRMLKNDLPFAAETFGFQEGADLQASDMANNGKTNFKISYRGSFVPVWMDAGTDTEKIRSVLAAALCGLAMGLNLVDISQVFKSEKRQ
jgi:hypothetical protein